MNVHGCHVKLETQLEANITVASSIPLLYNSFRYLSQFSSVMTLNSTPDSTFLRGVATYFQMAIAP